MLRAGRSGDRIPVGAKFSVPVQTGADAHPASYTVTTAYFPGVKLQGRGVDHALPSTVQDANGLELYLHLYSGTAQETFNFIRIMN